MVAFWSTLVESRKYFLVEEISDSSCVEQFILILAIETLSTVESGWCVV
jgi:hypothetical protein